MEQETHYDVLELDYRTCDLQDMKKAYKRLAMLHHPDRVAPELEAEASVKFRKIRDAFEVLSDGPRKLRYDTEMKLKTPKKRDVTVEYGNYFNKNGAPSEHKGWLYIVKDNIKRVFIILLITGLFVAIVWGIIKLFIRDDKQN